MMRRCLRTPGLRYLHVAVTMFMGGVHSENRGLAVNKVMECGVYFACCVCFDGGF